MTEDGIINSTVAKEVFEQIFEHDLDPEKYVEENGLRTVSDEGLCAVWQKRSWKRIPSPCRITGAERKRLLDSWWGRL